MSAVALLGWPGHVSQLIEAALVGEGHQVVRLPLDAEAPRALAKHRAEVVVVDRHAFLDVRALVSAVRGQTETAEARFVVVGPPEPVEVQGIEVVRQPGRALELNRLLEAVNRVSGRYAG